MLRKLLFSAAGLMIVGTLAAPRAEAVPFACFAGMTLQNFIDNPDGCFLGDKVFDVTGFTSNLTPSQVNVNISNPAGGANFNIQFDAAANLMFQSLDLDWDIRVFIGTDVISVVQDQMFSVAPVPTSDTVQFCAEGACLNAFNIAGLERVSFPGISTQDLQNSALYNIGATGFGLQSIEQVIQQRSVPEPASLMLLGVALLGGGVSLRRRLKTRA